MICYSEQGIKLTWHSYNTLTISIERGMLEQVDPKRLINYAGTKGWEVISDAFEGVTLLRRDEADLCIPTDPSYVDYFDRVEEAILRIAQKLELSPRAVLVETLSYAGEVAE